MSEDGQYEARHHRGFCDHKFIDSKNCLKCGIGFEELKAESLAESVAEQVAIACDPSPGNKSQDHYKSRRKLFEEVDKLIRGRVRDVLPDVTLEFKQKIDKDLGLDALRTRVNSIATGVSKDADAVAAQVEAMFGQRVDALLARLEREWAGPVAAAFDRRIAKTVAKECATQLQGLLLFQSAKAKPAPKAKKKKR